MTAHGGREVTRRARSTVVVLTLALAGGAAFAPRLPAPDPVPRGLGRPAARWLARVPAGGGQGHLRALRPALLGLQRRPVRQRGRWLDARRRLPQRDLDPSQ